MISNAPENDSSAVSSMHLKLRKECKEDYMKVDKKQGRDWITASSKQYPLGPFRGM